MNESKDIDSSFDPTLDDFREVRDKIYDFIRKNGHSSSTAAIANHIGRTEDIALRYCQHLAEIYQTIKAAKNGWIIALSLM